MQVQSVSLKTDHLKATATAKPESAEQIEAVGKQTDTFEKAGTVAGVKEDRNTYAKPKKLTADQLTALSDQRMSAFQKMLASMVAKQGEAYNLVMSDLKLDVSTADSQKAAASIAEGGEYSVDAVATRLMDMAYALSGGDTSKIDVLRNAVKEGFKAAGMDFGKDLPKICNDTYDETMKRFDEWEKTGVYPPTGTEAE